jgi:uncharacterized protein YbjT (DUF2867 family)
MACSRFRNRRRRCLTIPLHPKRGEGELAVRAAFVEALFVRPAVRFGPDDAFLTTILKLLRRLPVYPMFGRGRTRLQPAYVEDVAEAIGRTMQRTETPATIFEFGGPRVYSYEEFFEPLRTRLASRPDWSQSRLPFGTHSHGPPKYSRVRSSRAIKWN